MVPPKPPSEVVPLPPVPKAGSRSPTAASDISMDAPKLHHKATRTSALNVCLILLSRMAVSPYLTIRPTFVRERELSLIGEGFFGVMQILFLSRFTRAAG